MKQPLSETFITIPYNYTTLPFDKEIVLTISFYTKQAALGLDKDYEIAWDQFVTVKHHLCTELNHICLWYCTVVNINSSVRINLICRNRIFKLRHSLFHSILIISGKEQASVQRQLKQLQKQARIIVLRYILRVISYCEIANVSSVRAFLRTHIAMLKLGNS